MLMRRWLMLMRILLTSDGNGIGKTLDIIGRGGGSRGGGHGGGGHGGGGHGGGSGRLGRILSSSLMVVTLSR